MATLNSLGRQILDALRTRLIPWAEGNAPFLLLDAPPRLIGSKIILEMPGKKLPLQRGKGKNVRVQRWPEENLNTMTSPYMGCVIDGAADIVVGTTTAMCRELKIPGTRWIVQTARRDIFLVPPHIPISGGEYPHWERPHRETAHSRILWLQFHSTGISCHFCSSAKGMHYTHPFYFIKGPAFLLLADTLVREMREQSPQYLPMVYHYLGVLFHQMARHLLTEQVANETEEVHALRRTVSDNELIGKAMDFIDQNIYDQPLSLQQLSDHVQLSPRHLSRIFRRELNKSVKEVVITRRMELAKQLLLESQYNITHISRNCGYANPSSFIKAFIQYYAVSPTQYRKSHKDYGRIS